MSEYEETTNALRGAMGFRLRVTAVELRSHLKARAEHHRKRGEELVAKVNGIREKIKTGANNVADLLGEALGVGTQTMVYAGNMGAQAHVEQIVQSIELNIGRHRVTAGAFDWFASHIAEEAYDLSPAECSQLELVDEDLNQFNNGIANYIPVRRW